MSPRCVKIDRIDLWQLHRIDPKMPQKQRFDAIRSFIDEGLIRHSGLSQVSVEQIEAARKVFPVATVQTRYNLTDCADKDVLNYCETQGIGFIPWFPLAAGKLADKSGIVDELAEAKGAKPGQIALASMLKRSPVILPIPGTGKVAHLEENVAAAAIEFTDQEFDEIDAAAKKGWRPRPDPVGPDQRSVWEFPRSAIAEPCDPHVLIEHRGVTVTDTRASVRTLETSHPPSYSIQLAAIAPDVLRHAAGNSFCEWKGVAIHRVVVIGEIALSKVGWSYLKPSRAIAMLRDHVAFYAAPFERCTVDGIIVEPQPGVFTAAGSRPILPARSRACRAAPAGD